MKITYLHQYFNTPDMPGGTRSYEMARRLVDYGHEVNMVTSRRSSGKGVNWLKTNQDGIQVHWLPVPYSNSMTYSQRVRAFISFAMRSAFWAASLDADIVFATSTPLTIALPAVYAARRNQVPMVFEVRDLWPEVPIAMGALRNPLSRWLARSLEKWAYFNSAAIVALSPGMKDGVAARGIRRDRIAVIPNCSDNKVFACNSDLAKAFLSPRPWLEGRPLFLYAGAFGKINGILYLVNLARELLDLGSDIAVLLVGDGAEQGLVLDHAKRLEILGRNFFIEPQMPKNSMPGLYSAASIVSSLFLDLPEMRANSANKFFDALAASKPVFLNYGGWMHDLVVQHQCGVSAWGQPRSEVALQLHSLMHDPTWLKAAGSRGRQLAEQYFDRDLLAKQLEMTLVRVCNGELDCIEGIAPGVYC